MSKKSEFDISGLFSHISLQAMMVALIDLEGSVLGFIGEKLASEFMDFFSEYLENIDNKYGITPALNGAPFGKSYITHYHNGEKEFSFKAKKDAGSPFELYADAVSKFLSRKITDCISVNHKAVAGLTDRFTEMADNDLHLYFGVPEMYCNMEECINTLSLCSETLRRTGTLPQSGNDSKDNFLDALRIMIRIVLKISNEKANPSQSSGKSPVRISHSKTPAFIDIAKLQELTEFVSAFSLFDEDKLCELSRLYIPARLCSPHITNNSTYSMPKIVSETLTLSDVLKKDRVVILGSAGSGKTIALNAIAMRKCRCKSGVTGEFRDVGDLDDMHVFIMRCNQLNTIHIGGFAHYIRDSIESVKYNDRDSRTAKAYMDGLSTYHDTVLKKADQGKLLLLIDGLDHLNANNTGSAGIDPRGVFLSELSDFLRQYPKVKFVLTATPDVYCGGRSLYEYCRELGSEEFMVMPLSDDGIADFCRKWYACKGTDTKIADAAINIIQNDDTLRKMLGKPLLLQYFLSTIAPDRSNIFMSELMLISSMVDTTTRNFIAAQQSGQLLYKHNLKIPLGYIALKMTELNREILPLWRADTSADHPISVEDILCSEEASRVLDRHLTDRSFIRRGELSSFFEQISNNANKRQYPFVSIERKPTVRANIPTVAHEYFSFSSPIFQDYFASYAIGKRCFRCSLTDFINGSESVVGWMSICDYFAENDSEVLNRRVKILSDAALIFRERAEQFIDILCPIACDLTVQKRKYREFAVRVLLRVLSSNPHLYSEQWEEATNAALEECFYHSELADLERTLRSASRRELVIKHIYRSFYESTVSNHPIPRFNWCMGYIVLNWLLPTLENNSPDSPWVTLNEDAFLNELQTALNEKTACNDPQTVRAIREMITKTLHSGDPNHTRLLVLVAAFCSHIWILAKDTIIAESDHIPQFSADESVQDTPAELLSRIDDESMQLLYTLLKHPDQRIANQVCYSLMNCRSMQLLSEEARAKRSGSRSADTHQITSSRNGRENISKRLHALNLEDIVRADYNGRLSERIFMGLNPRRSLCGGLRLFTVIDITFSDYNKFGWVSEWKAKYLEQWRSYGGVDADGQRENDIDICSDIPNDNARFLMLFFKFCFVTGAWGDDIRTALKPMLQLFSLKYPDYDPYSGPLPTVSDDSHTIRKIGLAYDREGDFYRNLKVLFDQLAKQT